LLTATALVATVRHIHAFHALGASPVGSTSRPANDPAVVAAGCRIGKQETSACAASSHAPKRCCSPPIAWPRAPASPDCTGGRWASRRAVVTTKRRSHSPVLARIVWAMPAGFKTGVGRALAPPKRA
jgi:hypothetical protein